MVRSMLIIVTMMTLPAKVKKYNVINTTKRVHCIHENWWNPEKQTQSPLCDSHTLHWINPRLKDVERLIRQNTSVTSALNRCTWMGTELTGTRAHLWVKDRKSGDSFMHDNLRKKVWKNTEGRDMMEGKTAEASLKGFPSELEHRC